MRLPLPALVAASPAACGPFTAMGAMLGLAVNGLSLETTEHVVANELGRLCSLDRVVRPPETKVLGWLASATATVARPPRVLLGGSWGGDPAFAPLGSPVGRLSYHLRDLVHDGQSGPGVEDFLRKLKNASSLGAFTELDFLQRVVHTTLEGPALLWWMTHNEAGPF